MSSQEVPATPASITLRALLDERDMRPEDVAAALTISHRTVTRWLAGTNEPTTTMARRLGAYFDRDWREFYEGRQAA